ncbi:hypothetical protein B296_00025847 [Ensete ventricosum]|uniref:Uncharacterized protein n=1 Tax=Ensete ventricosum TaxID=4639 RepID=A0A426YDF8_ENSVE|nr:hypothetical protein B296_00025847 [Ensete ventricosum]
MISATHVIFPLRFPNSGIRTKVAGHGQAPCKGGRPRPGHLQRGGRLWPDRRGSRSRVTGYSHLQPRSKGCCQRLADGRAQEGSLRVEASPARAVARKSGH